MLPEQNTLNEFFSDLAYTKKHLELAEKAAEISKSISGVEAVILKGSLSSDFGDVFSDVDFLVLYQGEVEIFEKIKQHFIRKLSLIGNVILNYNSNGNPKDLIIYFQPLIKFDLNIRTFEQAASSWTTASGVLLFGRSGLGVQAIKGARELKFDMHRYLPYLKNMAIAIPNLCYIACGYAVRGEDLAALEDVDWLRNEMLKTSGYLLNLWDEGPRRAEKRFPVEVRSFYKSSRVKTVDEIWEAAEILLDWYIKWLVPNFEFHGLPHSGKLANQMKGLLPHLKSKKE